MIMRAVAGHQQLICQPGQPSTGDLVYHKARKGVVVLPENTQGVAPHSQTGLSHLSQVHITGPPC